MEGPTPVSALIHAATMVTAGVFLVIRCSPLFEYSTDVLILITVVGSLTAFFASTVGVVQNDIKRVIAYSTCSQLGYMIFACGISGYSVSFFHLINHAFFKALLFLASGIVIHALKNEQDMRKMGGLSKLLPYSYMMMLVGSLALGGFPFLSGFYSKDLILELSYSKYEIHSIFAYVLGSFSAFFTAFYSGRLLFLTFFNSTNIFLANVLHLHEGNKRLGLSLIILVIGSLFHGYFLRDMFTGFGTIFFDNAILILHTNSIQSDIEFIPLYIKLLPTVCSLTGFFLAFLIYILYDKRNSKIYPTTRGIFRKIYIFLSTK
jgi:NADH:ubiquinone oxidoreductase subunit 5 (subunit L)/multisubunit Na+/H+ antiporter MnhA subunit